jgi:hypothetical protein
MTEEEIAAIPGLGNWPRAVFKFLIAKKPAGRFMIRSRTLVAKRHPQGDW